MISPQTILKLCNIYFKQDISIKSRKNKLPLKRNIYYKLCKEFTKESFSKIGFYCNYRDHATVMHGVKKFDNELNQPHFKDFKIAYYNLRKEINLTYFSLGEVIPKTPFDIEQEYRVKHIKLIEKYRSILNKYQHNKMGSLKEIYELPQKDIEEFERLATVFIKRKKLEKQLN